MIRFPGVRQNASSGKSLIFRLTVKMQNRIINENYNFEVISEIWCSFSDMRYILQQTEMCLKSYKRQNF